MPHFSSATEKPQKIASCNPISSEPTHIGKLYSTNPAPFLQALFRHSVRTYCHRGRKKRSNSALLIAASISPIPSFLPFPLFKAVRNSEKKGKERKEQTNGLIRKKEERERKGTRNTVGGMALAPLWLDWLGWVGRWLFGCLLAYPRKPISPLAPSPFRGTKYGLGDNLSPPPFAIHLFPPTRLGLYFFEKGRLK